VTARPVEAGPRAGRGPRPLVGEAALLLAGVFLSYCGTGVTQVALSVHLMAWGSPWVAAASVAELGGTVVAVPLAARFLGQVPVRRLLVLALVGQALATAGIALAVRAAGPVWLVPAGTAAVGAGAALAVPAVSTVLSGAGAAAPRLMGRYSAVALAGGVAGFVLGGVAVGAVGVAGSLLVDTASYAVLAVLVAALSARGRGAAGGAVRRGVRGAWSRGVRAVYRDDVLRPATLGFASVLLLAVAVNVADVFLVLDVLGASATVYGAVTACWPLAGAVAAWTLGPRLGGRRLLPAMGLGALVMGTAVAGAGAVAQLAVLPVAWCLGGAANAVQRTCLNTAVAQRCPPDERAVVFGAVTGITRLANLAGLGLGAVAVALVGARETVVLSGIATVLVGVRLLLGTRRP